MELFEGPAVGDELRGEGVEDVALDGGGGADAEVAGGVDERGAEVPAPDAIHENAGGEGGGGAGEGAGEFEATAAGGGGERGRWGVGRGCGGLSSES